MGFRTVVKNLEAKQLLSLFQWFLKYPLFMLATIWATYKTLQIAEKEFPKIHNLHNKENAFRHALWNILIAKQASRFSSNIEEVLLWTKKITDWHEDFAPNDHLPRLMDLHNNAFGRYKFKVLQSFSEKEIVLFLKEALKQAVLVKKESDFIRNSSCLVYLKA